MSVSEGEEVLSRVAEDNDEVRQSLDLITRIEQHLQAIRTQVQDIRDAADLMGGISMAFAFSCLAWGYYVSRKMPRWC